MCYLGVGDTFTPIHKDLCASSGQNLMCFTENGGSSFWFMTDSSSTRELTNHFLALNKVLDHETHIMSLEEVADAATHVPIYVIEQRIGDLVLVPPRSYHQVVNAGGFTIKTSWSRVTLQGLQTALYHELPLYRRVCRLETYRIKSTIHHTVLRWTKNVLGQDCKSDQNSVLMAKSLAIILSAFDSVLLDEYCPRYAQLETVQPKCSLATEPEVQCDFCGADIFQSFFYCGDCVQEAPNEIADGFILCPGCYVEGRTCKCGSLKPSQWRAFETLLAARRAAHAALHSYWERNTTLKQVPLREERDLLHTSSKKGIFSACILLVERRKAFKPKDALRKCSTGSLSHDIPLDEWVYCKECHRARCFSHMLYAYDMHAVQILHALTDEKSVHERHKTSKINYHQKWELYEKQEKEGKQPEDIQLSDLAQTFTTCKPLHPGFVRPGWYDENIEIIRSTEGNLDHLKQKYYNLTASVSDRSRPLSKVSGGGNENRKRLFLDCVMLETQTRGVDSRNAASSRSATSEVSDGVEDESTNCSLFDSPIQSTQEGVRKRRKTTSHALPSNSEFARALDSNIQTTDTKTIIHRHRLKQPENNDRRKQRSAEETHLNGTPPSSQEL
ncbi:hypothetical protein E1B28_008926 [Marasmius oreades]|nr:uncharacterized protein E1B28_008926 [Marasmius oreades]KAG7092583.1 hypothetical protein E1B28_008926 [Marasmius oreades]